MILLEDRREKKRENGGEERMEGEIEKGKKLLDLKRYGEGKGMMRGGGEVKMWGVWWYYGGWIR